MFFEENSNSSFSSSLSSVIFENPGNDLNNEVNAHTSKIESCLSSESESKKQSETVKVISKAEHWKARVSKDLVYIKQ